MSRSPELPKATPRRLDTARGAFAALDTRPSGSDLRGTAVLVPGFTGSKEDFVRVLPLLSGSGWRTVAYDQRGQYESTAHDAPDAGYAVADLAADLLAVVEALGGEPVHVVGHSFGGFVVRAAALAEPGRFRSVVLLDTGPAAVSGGVVAALHQLREALPALPLPEVYDAVVAHEAGRRPADDVAAFLRRRYLANSPDALSSFAAALLGEPDRVAELRATGVPALVVHGSGEDVWPQPLQSSMAERLDAQRVVLEGSGHSPAAEDPSGTASALTAFWSSVEADQRPRVRSATR